MGFTVSSLQNPSLPEIIDKGWPTAYYFSQFKIKLMDINDNMTLFISDEDNSHLNGCVDK